MTSHPLAPWSPYTNNQAPVLKTATALYDYDKQTEEELAFNEGDRFNIYDLGDPDWLLVGAASGGSYGFIPSNYIEIDSGTAPAAPQAQIPLSQLLPPPQHRDRTPAAPQVEPETAYAEPPAPQREEVEDVEEDAPPPMPSRPGPSQEHTSRNYEDNNAALDDEDAQEHNFDGEYFKWYIDEVDGRKKRAVVLAIGNGRIILKPNTQNPKKLKLKSSSLLDNEWRVRDLVSFSTEKKHLFMDFKNPEASMELHAGSKDVADAIHTILGDLKGAEAAKGLREVAKASTTSTSASNRKIGRLLYDFQAQGDDELNAKEGDEVYIVNETKSRDWWMCEKVDSGRQGVVPSLYIEILGTTNLDELTDGVQRRKSQKASSKGRVVENKKKSKGRSRDERDRIRENDRVQRDKAKRNSQDGSADKLLPNVHRVRTWIDSSGSFKVEAEFLGCMEGKIHLHKTNGVKIAVAAVKLCVEDLEYVEKVTGTSLAEYKEQVANQALKRSKSQTKSGASKLAMAAINDVPPAQPARPKNSSIPVGEPDYDWFEFFLQCGVDLGNCQRYTLNFNREQMDENILEDISPSLLRTLGLREGDILRVMKFLDAKFDRKKSTPEPPASGSLFTGPTGALKNNSTTEVSKVDARDLPLPQEPKNEPLSSKFEDDAWAVKPAARSNEDLSKPAPQTPQYTGSLQDLVNIKPLELAPSASNLGKPVPPLPKEAQTPSAPALTPVKTGTLIQPGQQFGVQKTGSGVPANGLIPLPMQQTGGFIPVQPTGFAPITAQPTGFIPIQATGILQPQLTFGIVPLQAGTTTFTAQKTGPQAGPPATSFGQPTFVPLQTGNVSFGGQSLQQVGQMPTTTFGQAPVQQTGGQITGGFVPQSSFGQQITGGFNPVGAQVTGGQPQNGFGQGGQQAFGQATGGQQSVFGQATGGYPGSSFPQAQNSFSQPQNSFSQNIFSQNSFTQGGQNAGFQAQNANFQPQNASFQPQNTSFQQPFGQNTGGLPPTSFGQPSFPQTSFGQSPGAFSQPLNGQPSFGANPQSNSFQTAQPQLNQLTNAFQNTSIGGQSFGQHPSTTFGQQQFDGFNSQPLQSQPTGAGFGNGPSLQPQQTGRRANLQAATADNPFGF